MKEEEGLEFVEAGSCGGGSMSVDIRGVLIS